MGMMDYDINFLIGSVKNVEEYVSYKFEYDKFELGKHQAYGWHFYLEDYCSIVWVPHFPRTPREYGTFFHEISHAIIRMMDWAGVTINIENDEVFCHALRHLGQKVLEQRKSKKVQIDV